MARAKFVLLARLGVRVGIDRLEWLASASLTTNNKTTTVTLSAHARRGLNISTKHLNAISSYLMRREGYFDHKNC